MFEFVVITLNTSYRVFLNYNFSMPKIHWRSDSTGSNKTSTQLSLHYQDKDQRDGQMKGSSTL